MPSRNATAPARASSGKAARVRRKRSDCRRARSSASLRSLGCRVEQAPPAVAGPGPHLDQMTVDQVLHDAIETLFGDLQDIQQGVDRQSGMPEHEMQDAMVGPAEAVIFEEPIRVADEVPVGEEEQLDEVEHRNRLGDRVDAHRVRRSRGLVARRMVVAGFGQKGPRIVPFGRNRCLALRNGHLSGQRLLLRGAIRQHC